MHSLARPGGRRVGCRAQHGLCGRDHVAAWTVWKRPRGSMDCVEATTWQGHACEGVRSEGVRWRGSGEGVRCRMRMPPPPRAQVSAAERRVAFSRAMAQRRGHWACSLSCAHTGALTAAQACTAALGSTRMPPSPLCGAVSDVAAQRPRPLGSECILHVQSLALEMHV